ncbi:phage antirepressor KilAC domain-containing protein [Asaia lannensis]|uniref:Phage antirepressor KilAC domain-containing protein n=1 Tax=Asaia lannensis NBRC 102526 TaxID=1307926 RepID=A0ABT1CKV5_9PROT|nr:phage antirepressor KilAC domain-containing protein [Asaia lannensis]MCO6160649.1 phage antirepressor KilAC domain-containing protein [Asaia lannensis NBRC 102526]
MANDPTIFVFAEREVRTVMVAGENVWLAKDVAESLGYSWNGTSRVKHVPEEWRGVTSVVTPSGEQEMTFLTEAGLFFFLNRSDKPAALPFQKWVAGEVLPAIRKSGGYMVAAPDETPEELAARALIVMQATIERQKAQLAAAQPTLESHERLVNAKGRTNLREVGKELKIGSQKGIELMRQVGWIFKDARGKWKAYASAVDAGYVEMKYATFTNTAGEEVATQTVYVTPRGVTRLDARLAQH